MKGVIKIIGCDAQYLFKFSIGDKDDFIKSDDLDYFTLIEEAGNILPTWEISFRTTDSDIQKVWHEGNDLKVSYGVFLEKLIDVKLLITKKSINRIGDEKLQVTAVGIYSEICYITTPHVFISDKKSGVEVAKDIVTKYFTWDKDNLAKSNESQYWIQPKTTDKKFVDELLIHSYLTNSFIGTGITSEGSFIVKDIRNAITSNPKGLYKFTLNVQKENDILYLGDHYLESNTGFINCWVGYGKEKPVYNLENDTYAKYLEQTEVLGILSDKFERNSSVEKRSATIGMENENTHPTYWKASLKNIQGLSLFSSELLTLSYFNVLNSLKIFDVVMFKESDPKARKEQASKYESGLYITGLVSRSVSNNQFCTTVKLFREGHNEIIGNLR